jgi:crotonobetainyl-CoA:carnitine CoA-transferase CaiB-like acyl-CoA transferase
MLEGIHVLELGNGIAGASSTAILSSLGARVTKLTRVGSDAPLIEPTLATASGTRVSILASLLDRDKTTRKETGDSTSAPEVSHADIVICDRVVDAAGLPADRNEYAGLVERCNRGVWVTLTAFGLDGPYAAYRGSELISCAAGGLAATVTPKDGGRPSLLPGWQGMLTSGQVAALAALHGLDRRLERGRPVHVDVSSQEAVAMAGALPECAHAIYHCPGRAGSGRYVAPSGLFPCRDGFVRITAPDNHQWSGMVRAMGEPDWTRGLEDRPARAEHAERINREIELWTQPQGKAECAAQLQENGVPSTPVNGPKELLESPQFSARGFIQPATLGDVPTRAPGRPYTWAASGDAFTPEQGGRGLGGLRIAEFAHVLAGPIAGALLGAMGAHVVRFEDRARLDLYRRTGPFAHGIAGPERGAYFAVSNHSKHSLAVDVDADPDAARTLARQSDVVLENFGSKRMARLGVDAERASSERPGLLYVSLSGFGQSGPLASYRAYANTVHAYGGLSHLTRDTEGQPIPVTTVLADPLSSLTAATLIAAWALGKRRQGGIVDLSMAEVVASRLAEFIAEVGAGAEGSLPAGCDRFPHAPHAVHPTADDHWLAIAVQSDAEWEALVETLGRPQTLRDPAWSKGSERWAARREIEAAVDEITRGLEADELFHRLQQAGVRACPVWTGAELIHDAHLAARGFFPEIDHPDPDLTEARLVGLAWRFAGEGPIPLRPPPRLGNYSLPEYQA